MAKMAVGQAFAVAFGLAFLMLGGLYVVFRSGLATQRRRDAPTVPEPTGWLIAGRGLTAFMVALFLGAGAFLLLHPAPNVFFAAGVAAWLSGQAMMRAFGFTRTALRATWSAYVLGGLLCAAGAGLHGGTAGILGVTLSLAFSAFWLWALTMVRPR
jgi:hypothetical protein